MAEKIKIAELDIDTNAMNKKLRELLSTKVDLQTKMKDLKKATNNLQVATDEELQAFAELDKQLKATNTEYNNQKKAVDLVEKANKLAITSVNNEVKSRRQLRDELKILRAQRDEIKGTTEREIQLRDKLSQTIDDHTKSLVDAGSEEDKRIAGIGKYEDAITSALGTLGPFGDQVNNVYQQINVYTQGLQAKKTALLESTKATSGASRGLKLFRVALISTGIGAIVVALGLLVQGFLSTQRGMDAVTKYTRPLKEVLASVWGVVQNLATGLVDMAKNPKKALSDLVDFVKTNVMNRFKALAVIIDGFRNFDMKQVANGFLQAGSGVENVIDKVQDATKATTEFMNEAYERGQKLDQLQKEIERNEITLIERQGELNKIVKEQNKIGEDITKTDAQRVEAINKAYKASEELLILEQRQLDLQIKKMELSFQANDTSREDEKELAELKAKRYESETRQLEQQTTLQNKLNTVVQQRQAKRQKDHSKRLKRIKKETDSLIKKNEILLQIFIEENKNLEDSKSKQLKFLKDVNKKELAILEQKYKADKLTKEEYDLEKLKLDSKYLEEKERIEIDYSTKKKDLDNALFEEEKKFQDFKAKAFQKLEDDKELKNAKNEEERQIIKLKRQEERLKKELKQELNAMQKAEEAKRALQLEFDLANAKTEEEKELIRNEYNQTKIDRDLEYKDLFNTLSFELTKETEDKTKEITEKNAQDTIKIEKAKFEQKMAMAGNFFGGVADLLGRSTKAGKIAGIAQATINTYQGISNVWKEKAESDLVGAGFAQRLAVSALVLGKGLATVNQIRKTKTEIPKFYKGGKVPTTTDGIISNAQNIPTQEGGDNVLIMAKRGEMILNNDQQNKARMIFGGNVFGKIGVPGFFRGGQVGSGQTVNNYNNVSDLNAETIKEAVKEGFEGAKLVTPVDEITSIQTRRTEIETDAEF